MLCAIIDSTSCCRDNDSMDHMRLTARTWDVAKSWWRYLKSCEPGFIGSISSVVKRTHLLHHATNDWSFVHRQFRVQFLRAM
jgi:hypothetical protein